MTEKATRNLELSTLRCQNTLVSNKGRQWTGLRRFFKNRPASIGAVYLLALLVLFVGFSVFPRHSSTLLTEHQFTAPSWTFWMGTDVHGRDLFARTLFGLRMSLLVGCCGAVVSLVIGTIWGSVSAYLGGYKDSLMMRIVDVLYAMPSIIFVIVLMAAYDGVAGPLVERFLGWGGAEDTARASSWIRLLVLYVGLGAVSWLTVARIVRGEVLALRERTFVKASQVLGASSRRILVKHILPNLVGVLIVYLTLTIPTIILYESFLSFLGLGIQPPYASLGSLIADGAQQINPIRIYWWMIVFPGGALVLTLLALNLVGDGMRDLFNLRSSTSEN